MYESGVPPRGYPRPHRKSPRYVIALFDYVKRSDNDLAFRKGDHMEVLENSNEYWLHVKMVATGLEGFVPVNYVAEEDSLDSQEWYFPEISRSEAIHLLQNETNRRGTFLVRKNAEGFCLSVKDWQERKGFNVKHYRIKQDSKRFFYLDCSKSYSSIVDLINAYKNDGAFIMSPCPKAVPHMYDLAPSMADKWEIPRSDLELVRKLGSGNFADVYFGWWKCDAKVAVKKLRPGKMSSHDFLNEASIMKKIRHKNLVTLYGVCSQSEPIYIVQEYMEHGSLLEFLRAGEGKSYKLDQLVYIASQIASGMQYLEDNSLVHRDLAARNVLVGKDRSLNLKVKICDFGLARIMENEIYFITSPETIIAVKWTAPEAIQYKWFTIKSDVYSYGVLLMELFTKGQELYQGKGRDEIVRDVLEGIRMPNPADGSVPDDIYNMMLQCWNAKAEDRPTFQFLHDYFEEFNAHTEIRYREPDELTLEKRRFCMIL